MMQYSFSHWLLMVLFTFCCSCQSKPTAVETATPEKVTNGPVAEPTRLVELVVRTSLAPRRASELESGILLDAAVKSCMVAEFKDGSEPFSFSLQARLGGQGEIQSPLVITPKDSLKTCLLARFKTLQLGRGQTGTFKMKVERLGPMEISGGKATKTILLELDKVKKLQ